MPLQDLGSWMPMQDPGSRLTIQGLGPWDPFGAHLGPFGTHLGPILFGAHLGSFFILFGAHLGPFGTHLGPIWAHFGPVAYFGLFWPIFIGYSWSGIDLQNVGC